MKILIFLFLLLLSVTAFPKEIAWLSAGGSYSSFNDMHPKQARELKYGASWFGEFSIMDGRTPLLAPHYAYRSTTANDVKIFLDNQAPSREDFHIVSHEFAGKFILPLPWFDIYFGPGIVYSNVKVGEKERSGFGRFWLAGFHWYLNPHLGIKFGYQSNNVTTSTFSNLDDKRLKFEMGIYSVGLVLRFGNLMK